MTALRQCPNCGAQLALEGPAGNCPNCLFALASALTAEAAPDPAPPAGAVAPMAHPPLPTAEPSSQVPGPTHYFGDYELLGEIARGGMGVVYRARQVSLNRIVAVKVLLFGQFASDEFIRRFRTEAEAAANLHHPNIVAIHEIGEHEGRQYFSMDYVEGGHLGDLVREQPLPAKRAAALLRTIAEAVHHAHEHGVLHRDLKPSNVLIDTQGQPRLTDFGLAKRLVAQTALSAVSPTGSRPGSEPSAAIEPVAASAGSRPATHQIGGGCYADDLTLTGQILGTPNYASPEQVGGRRGAVTAASDVYSLGAILYFVLTGRPPFLGESLEQTLERVMHDEPVAARLLNPSVPRDLETICLKCLEKEPGKRYASALALAAEFDGFLKDEPIRARPVSSVEKLWRWCRRKPALAASIAALQLVGAAGLAGILWQWGRAERHVASETAQRLRAEEAVILLELQRADDLLEKDETVMGMSRLARIVRQQPTNHMAAQRLLSALTQRDFVLPVAPPLQHDRKVNYAEFSPDGRWVVTASLDFTTRLWDARTGQPAGEPMRHSNAVRYAHFSPDGQRLVTVADDTFAQLWETTTGRPVGQPLRHAKRVRSAQFSPDGRQVLTASDDQTARLWDARTGEPLSRPIQHTAPVRRALFSPDGRWIVTIPTDATARAWDAHSGQAVGKPLTHGTWVNAAQFSPDSRWLVTASYDGTARVWEATTGRPATEPLRHGGRVSWAEFSPDGQRVATASEDGGARLWDARTRQPLTAPLAHQGGVVTAQFSPDGQRLLTGWVDNAMHLRDARTGRTLAVPFQHDGAIWSARFSPDGQSVVTASGDKTARIWDIRPGRAVQVAMAHTNRVHCIFFSPDDEWLATASLDKTARIWSVRTGRSRTPPLGHAGPVSAALFSPDGQRVLTTSYRRLTASSDGAARLWNARTGEPLTEPLSHDGEVDWAEFSPDGKWFLTVSVNKAVRLWDASFGQLRSELVRQRLTSNFAHFSPDSRTVIFGLGNDDSARIVDIGTARTLVELHGHGGYITAADFSSDGRQIVTASEDGTARIWATVTGAQLAQPLVHKAMVHDARLSSDGLWVVTASADATARVWNVLTGRAVTEPLRHRGTVYHARFSPDAQRVITASADGTARLWDARTGRPLAEPFQHAGDVWDAIFSHDGQHVATASYDGTARVWELPPAVAAGETPAATLADVAEAVIGQRLGESGSLEPASSRILGELRQQLSTHPPTNTFTRWLAWFLADRSTRTISPNSVITVPEYVARRMEEQTLAAASEAVFIAPTNAPALAHLAEMLLVSSETNAPLVVAEAEFLIRRAETMAPGDVNVRASRHRIELRTHPPSTR